MPNKEQNRVSPGFERGYQNQACSRPHRYAATICQAAPHSVTDVIAECDDFDVDVIFNVAVVGSSGTGKSCLLRRFAQALALV